MPYSHWSLSYTNSTTPNFHPPDQLQNPRHPIDVCPPPVAMDWWPNCPWLHPSAQVSSLHDNHLWCVQNPGVHEMEVYEVWTEIIDTKNGAGGTILVLTPMKIKPLRIGWANSRHSEVQKRLIKFDHLHAKNESYLHSLKLNPSSGIKVSFSHCSFSIQKWCLHAKPRFQS